MKVREEIRCHGAVQGVGFRFSAVHIAQGIGLTGWVFNDYDGSVLMQVQGEKDLINLMLERLEKQPFIRIEKIERTSIPVERNDSGFHVR